MKENSVLSTEKAKINPDDELVWEESPKIVEPVLKIDEKPKTWWECILYGWQHTLVDITPLVFPLIVAAAIGLKGNESVNLVNSTLFAMGIATLIQTTIGNRLPIIQGPSITVGGTIISVGSIFGLPALWGAIFVGGIIEMLFGFTKLVGKLKNLIPITVSGIVVMCIGISLGMTAVGWTIGDGSPVNFFLGALVIFMVFFFQLVCKKVWNGVLSRGAIFFSIWIVGLGVAGVMGKVDWALIASKPWFAFPKLFPYGGPGFGWSLVGGAIVGLLAGYLGSIVESIGDYAATCAVCGEQYRVRHMNKGIFAEGLGCVIASFFGGLPCTSYTQNIGVIATTKIASRFVIKISAVILMLYGLSPKFGALLVAIPRPVLGAVFIIVCGSITVSGMKLINSAKDTTANSLLVGATLLMAIGMPVYVKGNMAAWLKTLSPFANLLLTNTVVIGVIFGIVFNLILNKLLGGKKEEEELNA